METLKRTSQAVERPDLSWDFLDLWEDFSRSMVFFQEFGNSDSLENKFFLKINWVWLLNFDAAASKILV